MASLAWMVAGLAAGLMGGRLAARHAQRLAGTPVLAAIVAASALAGAAAPGEPTGNAGPDLVLRAAFAGLAALAGARATRQGLLVAAGLVAATAGGAAIAAAFAALGATGALLGRHTGASRRSRVVGTAAGGLVGNAALRLAWPEAFGATAAVAGAALAVLGVSALRRAHPLTRRRAAIVAALLTGASLALSAAALLPLWATRSDADAAIAAGSAALAAARQGDSAGAVTHFDRAERLLEGVRSKADAWWARPARAVPVLAQHLDALSDATAAASALADAGSVVARQVDVERVRPRQGRVDVHALASFADPLAHTDVVLVDVERRLAEVNSEWLVSALEDRVERLAADVSRARVDNRSALEAARIVPELLGRGGHRRWFLAVVTPSELRGGGGIIGNWGVLTAEDGTLDLPVFERIRTLYRDEPYRLAVDPEWDARYVQRFDLAQWPQNLAVSPHFPSTAEAIRQVAEQAGVGRLDGVLQLDPYALAAVLRLTGPVTVDGWPEPITADNAAEVLLYRQYENAQDPDRPDFLEDTTRRAFDRFTEGVLPSPPEVAEALAPALRERRVQLHAFDPAHQAYLARLGATADLPTPTGDALGLAMHSASSTKLDWFLRRSIAYDVHVEPDGRATATVEVRLRNLAPPTIDGAYFFFEPFGLRPGENRHMVSLYSRLPVTELTVDGDPVEHQPSTERGHAIADVFVDIPPEGETVLRYRLEGTLSPGDYRLDLGRQPAVAPDEVTVTVNGETHRIDALTQPLVLTTPVTRR